MTKISADRFVELLKSSGLVEADRLEKLLSEFDASRSSEVPADPQPLVEFLTGKGVITDWQAGKLLEGRHKGFTLGNYKLLRHLGSGGMSSVFLAEHRHMKQRRAVKVLPRNRVNDSSYLDRFYLEARAAAALDHPNIVRAYDVANDGDNHYLVMEFVEGTDLQQTVKANGPMQYDFACDCIRQAACGLAHAHDRGLVHRDIKPANLLVDPTGTIKVLDMGLARLVEDDGEAASLTKEHDENILGTVDYLAPEQAVNSHNVDHRADIYSLGCTLYYLLTGRPPFPEGGVTQRLMKHQTADPPSIFKDRPDAPKELVAICERMMLKSADKRYQSAHEVEEACTQFLVARGVLDHNQLLVGTGNRAGTRGAGSTRNPLQRDSGGWRTTDLLGDRPTSVHDTLPNMEQPTIKGPGSSPSGAGSDSGLKNTGSSSTKLKGKRVRVARAKAVSADGGAEGSGGFPIVTDDSSPSISSSSTPRVPSRVARGGRGAGKPSTDKLPRYARTNVMAYIAAVGVIICTMLVLAFTKF